MSDPLAIVAHPDLSQSRINTAWIAALQQAPAIAVHDLYGRYRDEAIDVQAEQQLLLAHDRIVLQFPFHWYNCPPLLKKWLDVVLEHGRACGPGADGLKGKQLGIAVSTWSKPEDYRKHGRYGRAHVQHGGRAFR
ncbi:hypothetical protein CAL14_11760 [Bordetella genomosp. 9]|uniref:NAD(P)H-dependent oxidoreductase n=1 Tax=Bordetella genomosp. 9 TaxID=1416803 RepID=UPI000A291FDF|nr:NAD(P)H-dependent oxidoreductase [Bordetella genomosp. 9]ARP90878.1 hypothetical protein CAL14_11760 [Bordetella genomosp. 9]